MGQCHKYVAYEMRPRYAIGETESARPAPRSGAPSRAMISTTVTTTTTTPRVMGDIFTIDDPNTTMATERGGRGDPREVHESGPEPEELWREREQGSRQQLIRAGVGAEVRPVELVLTEPDRLGGRQQDRRDHEHAQREPAPTTGESRDQKQAAEHQRPGEIELFLDRE